MAREQRLLDTVVELADTMVDDYDVIDFLQLLAERCVELLDTSEAGVMLADGAGQLRHAACSTERMRIVELFELQLEEGPCFDAYRTNEPVVCTSPDEVARRWPRFAPHAHDAGFESVAAVPMRLRSEVIGALNLFSSGPLALGTDELRLAQALADVATIGILQQRAIHDARIATTQLEVALESRIVIEQAKGIVAEHNRIGVDEAFALLRNYTRSHNRLLAQTARDIIDYSLNPSALEPAD
jgi:GAF domain-containing protein